MSVKKKQTQTKEKKRLFDRNTRRLIRSMKPIRGWLTLSAMLCAVLIGCAVAAPQSAHPARESSGCPGMTAST